MRKMATSRNLLNIYIIFKALEVQLIFFFNKTLHENGLWEGERRLRFIQVTFQIVF